MSREAHTICKLGMIGLNVKFKKVMIVFRWIEKNQQRDKDNIAFAKKFIIDSMQEWGIIPNDGWNQILGFADEFYVDKKNPRIEVLLYGEDEENGKGP
jgi:hypothetical protein